MTAAPEPDQTPSKTRQTRDELELWLAKLETGLSALKDEITKVQGIIDAGKSPQP